MPSAPATRTPAPGEVPATAAPAGTEAGGAVPPTLPGDAAPVTGSDPRGPERVAGIGSLGHDDEMPRIQVGRRSLVTGLVVVVLFVLAVYLAIPSIAGISATWERIEDGDPWWLAAALGFTVLSFAGYVMLFRSVYRVGERVRLSVSESYQVTMAGLAATRLLAAGGAGGIALTAWAMRRAGMSPRAVADRTVSFIALTHAVYMLAMLVGGLGLHWALFPGAAPWAVTVLPAALGGAAIAAALLLAAVPTDLGERLAARRRGAGRAAGVVHRLATAPSAVSAGVRDAIAHLRRGDPATLGAVGYWGFQVATLWAAFEAFGDAPPVAVLVVGYFVGFLGNLLPLPGGIGGVDGGMIGAFAAFGVDAGLALVAVLTYRVFAFWLPTVPGVLAYFQLRRTVRRWRADPWRRDAAPA